MGWWGTRMGPRGIGQGSAGLDVTDMSVQDLLPWASDLACISLSFLGCEMRKDVSQRVKLNGSRDLKVHGTLSTQAKHTPLSGASPGLGEGMEGGSVPQDPYGRLRELLGTSGTGREGISSLVGLTVPQGPPLPSGRSIAPHTCLICLKPSGGTLEKMLHSGLLRIWKATAQWWFSRGEMSL